MSKTHDSQEQHIGEYYNGTLQPNVSTPEISRFIPLNKRFGTQEFYLVSLVVNNVIEKAHLYLDYQKATAKFMDLALEHCHNFSELSHFEIDCLLKQGFIKSNGHCININKVRLIE